MRSMLRPAAIAIATMLVAAACSSAASPSAAPTTAPTAAPPATAAPATAAPSVAPSEAPSAPAVASEAPTPDVCAKDALTVVTPGKLTIGTDNPAYPPYFQPSDPNPAPWELGDPTNGQGFESAVAYAVADKLGFAPTDVTWLYEPFSNSYAPGDKKFDFDINQVSWTIDRTNTVDLSRGYYFVAQAVVALKGTPISKVTTITGLKPFQLGAQVGTTSLDMITNVVAPDKEARVYDTNDAAIQALKAKQIDGIVVDLPTAFYMTAAQLDNGVIVGQFPTSGTGGEYFSLVLKKGSALTPCVDKALLTLRDSGTLDSITKTWLSDKASAPVFQP